MITRIQKALAARREQIKDGDKGFTLIELLVVVIIIGILAAIAIPVYINISNNAKDSAVQSDLTNIKTSVVAYQTNNTGTATPQLNVATLGSYGFTNSASYTTAPNFATNSTSTLFCIGATSVTGNAFYVSSNSGVKSGTCPTTTSTW